MALRRDSTRLFWTGIVAAAVVFQISPILTIRRPWLAVMLTEPQLDAHAHALATHRIYLLRQIIVLLKLMGAEAKPTTPEEFGTFVADEYRRIGAVMRNANIKAQGR